jgi:hypothetical protein
MKSGSGGPPETQAERSGARTERSCVRSLSPAVWVQACQAAFSPVLGSRGKPWAGPFCCTRRRRWRSQPLRQELLFATKDLLWLTSDRIESMHEHFMACMSKIAPEHQDVPRKRTAIKVEIDVRHNKLDITERCHRWGAVVQGVGVSVAMRKLAPILALLLGTGGPQAVYADPTTNYSYPHLYDAGVPFYQYHYVYREPRALGRAGPAVRRWHR